MSVKEEVDVIAIVEDISCGNQVHGRKRLNNAHVVHNDHSHVTMVLSCIRAQDEL